MKNLKTLFGLCLLIIITIVFILESYAGYPATETYVEKEPYTVTEIYTEKEPYVVKTHTTKKQDFIICGNSEFDISNTSDYNNCLIEGYYKYKERRVGNLNVVSGSRVYEIKPAGWYHIITDTPLLEEYNPRPLPEVEFSQESTLEERWEAMTNNTWSIITVDLSNHYINYTPKLSFKYSYGLSIPSEQCICEVIEKDVTVYENVTMYKDVNKTRTVTKYQDVEKTITSTTSSSSPFSYFRYIFLVGLLYVTYKVIKKSDSERNNGEKNKSGTKQKTKQTNTNYQEDEAFRMGQEENRKRYEESRKQEGSRRREEERSRQDQSRTKRQSSHYSSPKTNDFPPEIISLLQKYEINMSSQVTFDMVKKKRKYWLELLHPDKNTNKSEETRKMAEDKLKEMNDVYRQLRDYFKDVSIN
ncbi:MAG: J domain-containing protein [Methanofastidiosum sp.]